MADFVWCKGLELMTATLGDFGDKDLGAEFKYLQSFSTCNGGATTRGLRLGGDIEPGGGHTSEIFLQNTTCAQ